MGIRRGNRTNKGRAEGTNAVGKEGAVRGKEGVQGGGRAAGGKGVQVKRGCRDEYGLLEGKGVAGGEERLLEALGENEDLEEEQQRGKGSAGGSEGQLKSGVLRGHRDVEEEGYSARKGGIGENGCWKKVECRSGIRVGGRVLRECKCWEERACWEEQGAGEREFQRRVEGVRRRCGCWGEGRIGSRGLLGVQGTGGKGGWEYKVVGRMEY